MGTNNVDCLNEQTEQLVEVRCNLQWLVILACLNLAALLGLVVLSVIKS